MKIPVSIPLETFRIRFVDVVVFIFLCGLLEFVIYVASEWSYPVERALQIDLDPRNIPSYAAQSLMRMALAYLLSLVFSIWYGYTASRSRMHERIMIPLLDILQSIPVLSFLPAVVLAMINLFPGQRIGIEIACILLIFTGQVWNMTFSYYHSINTIPRELREASSVLGFNRFSRFIRLDLPFSAIGLVWNSMMSVSGGWFFLMACEMFVLEDRDFRLPGIGSYIQTAASEGNISCILYGLGAMVFLIIVLDILLWRPLIVWSQRFRMDTVPPEDERESIVFDLITGSVVLRKLGDWFGDVVEWIEKSTYRIPSPRLGGVFKYIGKLTGAIELIALGFLFFWALIKVKGLVSSVSLGDLILVFKSACYSFLRTSVAILIALLWTLPVGVYIGMNPRAANILQGMVQIAASIPATAVFPVIILFLIKLGGGLDIGAIFLMLLGTQWYLLFNIIAGAYAIPKDLIEISKAYNITGWRKWRVLILPSIFPYLVTGLITASGGAWNATIVSEYVSFGGEILKTQGLGALISHSSASGDFGLLFVSTCVMAAIVVGINRLVWKRLFYIAKTKYVLE
ncbi:MAG: ABC transporter permease subunit [Syntrophobacterales bacterium]|nr:ABC transporter permease subunit [Syntrophobacterales bacterium]